MTLDDLRGLVGRECVRLAKLGQDGIARELASRGMQGRLNDCYECPIARSLADTLLTDTGKLNVGPCDVSYRHQRGAKAGEHSWLASFQEGLQPINDFIRAFDAGQYPHLVARE